MEPIDAEPLPGLLLPTGQITPGVRKPSTLRLRNARVACAFDLEGKRVLNLGCAWGLHSFYMASKAAEVVGLDHSADRIGVAEATKKVLGISNVEFKCGDIRDPKLFDGLPRFDLVIAWGFLHRISDIFALLHALAPMTDVLSLEWRTPVLPLMSKLSLAYHPTAGKALNPRNLGPLESESDLKVTDQADVDHTAHGSAGFWEPTPGAVSAICRRFGYKHSRVLGYGEKFESGATTVLRHWVKHFTKRVTGRRPIQQFPLGRVHMILERSPGSIALRDPLSAEIQIPMWDRAIQNAMGEARRSTRSDGS